MIIGFIGLGVMGAPMAAKLVEASHQIITTLNRSPLPTGLNAKVLDTARAVAEASEVVITILPDTPDVERVLMGTDGVLEGISAGKLVIDMSSISPIETKAMAKAFKDKGVDYVDAPVSGGEVGAKAATLTIMAGGSQAAFERAKGLFELMGKNITLVGEENGAGQTCKIANQIIVALNIEAVAEALVFASKAGCDPAKVRDALMGGFASSKILEVHGERMINRKMDPGFRINLHQKDLNLALQSARALGVSLPNTATTQELMNNCAANGESASDHSGIVRALERLANHKLG
ncbi:2-hydroxy-3-oxopropionate reductase [Pseudorhodobacter turbinis]|uniref:2-hydroxy-3-oxopropionate reductase n=1 Tax=Pseudorhodobacter turbinis TaxID=2500533 RepID=A0A4P8EHS2_9RHOB|nr:2-hydroxy-3-oxopropionate reductase [Pseudorhodobacter turbinis]QCO56439.1 2-hydroxy-3-oxopropionate reductase [Pseudorhodobacter turbinis]